MSATARLSLPYIAPQQAQKQVTYNTAMAMLDQLVQTLALSRSVATPPAGPVEGDTYIVGAAATGDWAGHEDAFAYWAADAWSFRDPAVGWLAYVADTAELAMFQPGGWIAIVSAGGLSVSRLGINAVADLTTRLVVAAAASRFDHDGTDHRLAVNKATAADTASLTLQTGLSGRAELGLMADDDVHLKVSPDGSTWHEALSVSAATGLVRLPLGQVLFPASQNASSDPNTLDDYEEGTWTPLLAFGGSSTGITYSAATKGRYTKIGRSVSISLVVTLTSKGSASGPATIGGLPFAAPSGGPYGILAVPYVAGISGVSGIVSAMIPPGVSSVSLYQTLAGVSGTLSNAHFTDSTSLWIGGTYDAA